jgi:hypothetical protein
LRAIPNEPRGAKAPLRPAWPSGPATPSLLGVLSWPGVGAWLRGGSQSSPGRDPPVFDVIRHTDTSWSGVRSFPARRSYPVPDPVVPRPGRGTPASLDGDSLPAGDEFGLQLVVAGDRGLAFQAGEHFEDDRGLELRRERSATAFGHRRRILGRPALTIGLVQSQGRTSLRLRLRLGLRLRLRLRLGLGLGFSRD